MMLNLFSMFDPHMGFYTLNWISSILILMISPMIFWTKKSRFILMFYIIQKILWMEFKLLLVSKFNANNLLMFISLFMFILMNNIMGLFPYIFTSTSHLTLPLMFAMSSWMGMMMFGWFKNTNFMFSHLVPLGTPFMLMFFMVLIETLSNIIRPMTLAIRLTANMIAGHLLLTLLSSSIPSIVMIYFIMLITQMILLLLEMAVSIIQSYVFTILMILYLKETNYDKI